MLKGQINWPHTHVSMCVCVWKMKIVVIFIQMMWKKSLIQNSALQPLMWSQTSDWTKNSLKTQWTQDRCTFFWFESLRELESSCKVVLLRVTTLQSCTAFSTLANSTLIIILFSKMLNFFFSKIISSKSKKYYEAKILWIFRNISSVETKISKLINYFNDRVLKWPTYYYGIMLSSYRD
jgi:hypothetical protein